MIKSSLRGLTGKNVEVLAGGMTYRGKLIEVTHEYVLLRRTRGFSQIPAAEVETIKAAPVQKGMAGGSMLDKLDSPEAENAQPASILDAFITAEATPATAVVDLSTEVEDDLTEPTFVPPKPPAPVIPAVPPPPTPPKKAEAIFDASALSLDEAIETIGPQDSEPIDVSALLTEDD